METHCIVCRNMLKGRTDKKYCNIHCKNLYHKIMRQVNRPKTSLTDAFLHRNRIVLVELFRKTTKHKLYASKSKLLKMGFKFEYHTGYYINRERKKYHYIYDFRWMQFSSRDVMIIRGKADDPFYNPLHKSNFGQIVSYINKSGRN